MVGQGRQTKEGAPPWPSIAVVRIKTKPRREGVLTIQLPMPVLGVLVGTREAFHELRIQIGRDVLIAMMESDREALCGPKADIKVRVERGEVTTPGVE